MVPPERPEIQADADVMSSSKRNELSCCTSISEPSLDPLSSGQLPQAHNDTGSRSSLVAEDEGGVSPEVNSSTSQSEDPSLQLVSAWHWDSVPEGLWRCLL